MEKGNLVTVPPTTRRSIKSLAVAFLLAGGLFYLANPINTARNGSLDTPNPFNCSPPVKNNDEFNWEELRPTKKLKWVPCHSGHECARLEVPLDYHDHDAGYAAIALIRIPAKTKGKHYKGPVLFNPGGPGGSGVLLVQHMGHLFQEVLGGEYDIVGFDPRGIGYTTPVVDVFSEPIERAAWGIRHIDAPFPNETSNALALTVARSKILSMLVSEKVPVAAQHVNTAVVATDMLSIVKAHGFDKLQYWGFSYGSVLGSTFASLYPDNVGRLVIDGVVDADNYYKAAWDNNLKMADAGLETVFKQCAESGDACGLHESTSEGVKERYLRLVKSVKENPVAVHNGSFSGIISTKHIRLGLFSYLYSPYIAMKPLFFALKALEEGDGLPLFLLTELVAVPTLQCDCGGQPPVPTGGPESGISVYCSDGLPVEDNHEDLYHHYEKLVKDSQFGDIWSQIRMACVDWKVKPKWEWRGPIAGNTSFPLLLVGNTEDPVTPFAKKMSKYFKDSAVLMQNSAGHCSLAASSLCTAKAIRDYFQEGILPAKGTVCEIESHMFLDKNPDVATTEEDAKLLKAWRALEGRVPFMPFPHRRF